MRLSRDDLKPFQLRAAGELSGMLATYPGAPFKVRYNPETGEPYPFLCRLWAITGSGKTPILAATAADLKDAIVLWTTNRGAIISQTAANLSEGGRYSDLLPEGTEVRVLSDMSRSDWIDIVTAPKGLTILLSTVAAFNQDGDKLRVHRGDNPIWETLAGKGESARARHLYVIYDEGHGATEKQFRRLIELTPRSIIMASASPLPEELSELLPGGTSDIKSDALKNQTVVVSTPEVVEAGLLKSRLYLVDCNTTRNDALEEANDRWFELSEKLGKVGEWPILCCVVNSTSAGLEVWEVLTQKLGVDTRRVAVHLSGLDRAVDEANSSAPFGLLVNTYKAKKSPEVLRNEGYTHLIWNLSLREGWDEPWAYVAYMDGVGKSVTDISQKIGRFLRQPHAKPFDDGDLNSAYFYFNVPDEEFAALLRDTQAELESQGHEVIPLRSNAARPRSSRESPVKRIVTIPMVAESFGQDLQTLDKILLDNVPLFVAEELQAPGRVSTRVLDLRHAREDTTLRKDENRAANADVRVWDYLIGRLAAHDSRVARKNGTCFTSFLRNNQRMQQKMQFGSVAMDTLNRNLTDILRRLNDELRLEYEPDQVYEVKPFSLVSPDLHTDDSVKRERYRVRTFSNALHAEYNGMNRFEIQVAQALDALGLDWCRNPSNVGYSIPIPVIGEGTARFFPDFLLWAPSGLWAIDPKGAHLVNDAIYSKLLNVSNVDGLPIKIRVAFVVEGEFILGPNERPQRRSARGCTLIWKRNVGLRAKHFASPKLLVAELK